MASFSSLSILLLLPLSFLLLSPAESRPAAATGQPNFREALEIIIGGGGHNNPDPNPPEYPPECPPPPPPPCPSPPPEFENERLRKAFFVIRRLKSKIKSGRLDVVRTWQGNDVCQYVGFRCDPLLVEKERSISAVMFNGFRFGGPELFLEGFMDELDDIAVFHANSNFFRGPIPKKIDRQRFFYEMDLSNNKLPGGFPTNVLGASELTFLDLRYNNYCGPIPEQIFDMDIISAIYINNNQFSSNLPDNLGKTPAKYLTFAHNQFSGSIPKSIGDAKKTMEEIVFFDNQLEGCLPFEIGSLENAVLFDAGKNRLTGPIPLSFACLPFEIGSLENAVLFDAGKNRLTGPIPLSFACLAKAELLYLADNQLYGPVPEEICKLPNLGNFTLRNNFFTQVGAECKKLIKKKILDVSNNCIPGLPKQRSKEECLQFAYRPKYCGNDKSFTYIPCKNNHYLHPHVSKPTDNINYVSPKKTYAALTPPS